MFIFILFFITLYATVFPNQLAATLSEKMSPPTLESIRYLLVNDTDLDSEEVPEIFYDEAANVVKEDIQMNAYDIANLDQSDNATLADLLADDKFTLFHFDEPTVSNSTALGAAWLEDSCNTIIGFDGKISGEIFFIQEHSNSTKTRVYGWVRNLDSNSLYQLTIGKYGDLQSNHSCNVPQIYYVGRNKTNYMNVPMTSNGSGIGLIDTYTSYAPLYGKYSVIGRMLIVRKVVLEKHPIQLQRNNVTGELELNHFDFHSYLNGGANFHRKGLLPVACGVIGIANDFNVIGPNNEFFVETGGTPSLVAGYFVSLAIMLLCM